MAKKFGVDSARRDGHNHIVVITRVKGPPLCRRNLLMHLHWTICPGKTNPVAAAQTLISSSLSVVRQLEKRKPSVLRAMCASSAWNSPSNKVRSSESGAACQSVSAARFAKSELWRHVNVKLASGADTHPRVSRVHDGLRFTV